jgi:hypothetical protein
MCGIPADWEPSWREALRQAEQLQSMIADLNAKFRKLIESESGKSANRKTESAKGKETRK